MSRPLTLPPLEQEAARPIEPSSPWRRALTTGLAVWLASHVAYAFVTFLSWRIRGDQAPGLRGLGGTWLRWDTGHFVRIADRGYGVVELDTAFFPLYPLLIRAANAILPGGSLPAALVVANIAGFGMLVVLHRLTSHEFGEATAARTIYYLVAFPTAFYLAAAYNESLFLLFALGALYAARRNYWWVAGVCGAFASGTRSAGILLIVPLLYEYLQQRNFSWRSIRPDVLSIFLTPIGIIGFASYCWWKFDDVLAFSHVQEKWYRKLSWPWESLWRTSVEAQKNSLFHELTIVNTVDLFAALFGIVLLTLCLVGPWKFRPDQRYLVVYGAVMLLYPLVFPAGDTRPLISMARLVLEVLPAFMVLGRIGERSFFDLVYPMPAIAVQSGFLVIFLAYTWVA